MEIKKEKIEAGLIDKVFNWLGKTFTKALEDTLEDLDREIKNIRTNDKGGMIGTIWPEDKNLEPYRFKLDDVKQDDEGNISEMLSFEAPDGKVYDNVLEVLFKNTSEDTSDDNSNQTEESSLENTDQENSNNSSNSDTFSGSFEPINLDEVKEVCKEFEDRIMVKFPVRSSTNITLKKIVGSDETTIDLIGVCTECPPTTTLSNLNTVLDDSDFIASIPDNEECSYSIADTGDDLVVDPFEGSIETSDSAILKTLLSDLVVISDNIRFLRDNCSNSDVCNPMICEADWKIQDDITDITSYIAICGDQIPNHGDLKSNIPYFSVAEDLNTAYFSCVNDIINEYKLYNLSICNPEIRQGLDSKLLSWEQTLTSVR